MSFSLAIVVQGRFHAFDLARALIRQGVQVRLLTNYPKRTVRRFGIPDECVRNFLLHGVAARLVNSGLGSARAELFEPFLHRWFGRWAACVLDSLKVHAIYSFSGVSEEILRRLPRYRPLRSVVRGSVHIGTQARLLSEEQTRCGQRLQRPTGWMIKRELREYQMADLLIVLSSFARRSFVAEGFPPDRLRILHLATDLSLFGAEPRRIEARCRRILAGERLRVLTVGSFSYQKGVLDLARIAEQLSDKMTFRFVGDCPSEARGLKRRCRGNIEFISRQRQFDLPRHYPDADLFLFPTIQDGFGVVLAQANAAGLPLLTTTNCAGPDLVRESETGWVLPIRQPQAFVDRLIWCDNHRRELAQVVSNCARQFCARDWSQTAADLLAIYDETLRRGHTADAIKS